MKKIYVIAICVLLLAVSTSSVFAGKWVKPVTVPFYVVNGSSNNVSDVLADGKVHIVDPMGKTSLIIQGHVKGLIPNTGYDAWVRDLTGYTGNYLFKASGPSYTYYKLVTFTTDEFGNADFLIKLNSDELPDGEYQIQVAINLANDHSTTVIATQWPGIMVTVESK